MPRVHRHARPRRATASSVSCSVPRATSTSGRSCVPGSATSMPSTALPTPWRRKRAPGGARGRAGRAARGERGRSRVRPPLRRRRRHALPRVARALRRVPRRDRRAFRVGARRKDPQPVLVEEPRRPASSPGSRRSCVTKGSRRSRSSRSFAAAGCSASSCSTATPRTRGATARSSSPARSRTTSRRSPSGRARRRNSTSRGSSSRRSSAPSTRASPSPTRQGASSTRTTPRRDSSGSRRRGAPRRAAGGVARAVRALRSRRRPLRLDLLPSRRAYSGEEGSRVVLRRNRETAEERWLDVRANPVFAPDGSVELVVNVSRDITAERLAEQRRLRSEEQVRFLARASELLVVSLDWQETVAAIASLAVPELAGYSSSICSTTTAPSTTSSRRTPIPS